LETIIKNYDSNVNHDNSLVIIGENSFKKWDIPIEACLFYGDTISIFKYIVYIYVEYEQLKIRLEVNLTHGIKKLKEIFEKYLKVHFEYVGFKFENKFLEDESKSLNYYGLFEESTILVCDYKIRLEEIYIHLYSGKKIKINVELKNKTIVEIKRIIENEEGIPMEHQCLSFYGKKLNDEKEFLIDYGINEGSTIRLIDLRLPSNSNYDLLINLKIFYIFITT